MRSLTISEEGPPAPQSLVEFVGAAQIPEVVQVCPGIYQVRLIKLVIVWVMVLLLMVMVEVVKVVVVVMVLVVVIDMNLSIVCRLEVLLWETAS